MMIHNDKILVIVYLAALQLQNRAVFPEVAKKTAFPFYVEGEYPCASSRGTGGRYGRIPQVMPRKRQRIIHSSFLTLKATFH